MSSKTEDETLNSVFIKDYIKEYFENETEENAFMIYGQLMLRVCEGGKAPMPLMNITSVALSLDPDADAKDMFTDIPDSELYVRIKGKNGRYWLPLFTDRSEMQELADTNPIKEVPIKEIFELAHSLPGLNGVLINPFTDGFTLVQEQLSIMLETEPDWKEALENAQRSAQAGETD